MPETWRLWDLYAESVQTLQGSLTAVSKSNFAKKKTLAEIYTMHSFAPFLESIIENWGKKNLAKTTPKL